MTEVGLLSGEVGWLLTPAEDRCPRCRDINYTPRRVCLTCSGDPSGATYLASRAQMIRDRRRVA